MIDTPLIGTAHVADLVIFGLSENFGHGPESARRPDRKEARRKAAGAVGGEQQQTIAQTGAAGRRPRKRRKVAAVKRARV